MRKTNALAALTVGLLAVATAPRGNTRTLGLTPHWVADYTSLEYYGAGAPLDFATFTDPAYGPAGKRRIPSGTAVAIRAADGRIIPADGVLPTFFLFSAAQEGLATDSISGYGVVTGGNIYETQLPQATGTPRRLPVGPRGTVPARILLQP